MSNKCDDQNTSTEDFYPSSYWYDKQVMKYAAQFMMIFDDLFVRTGVRGDGKRKFIDVPVVYGSRDRVTASMLAGFTQNKPIRIPMISIYVNGIGYGEGREKGKQWVDRHTELPTGGIFPEDIQTVERLMPIPYDLFFEAVIMTSNTDQNFQILEQILPHFDPSVQIQATDDLDDWESLTNVTLTQIGLEENYPPGPDPRFIVTPLQFVVPVWLSAPKIRKAQFVEKMRARIATVPQDYPLTADVDQYIGDANVDIRDLDIGVEE